MKLFQDCNVFGTKVYRTDQMGEISVVVDKKGNVEEVSVVVG